LRIELDVYGIVLTLEKGGQASITSELHESHESPEYAGAMDALESLILGHACAGVNIEAAAYLEGIESAVEACANNL